MGYKPYFMEIKLWREFHFYNMPQKRPKRCTFIHDDIVMLLWHISWQRSRCFLKVSFITSYNSAAYHHIYKHIYKYTLYKNHHSDVQLIFDAISMMHFKTSTNLCDERRIYFHEILYTRRCRLWLPSHKVHIKICTTGFESQIIP